MGHISSKKILPFCQFGSTNKSGDISRSVLGAGQSTLSTLFIDLNCSLTPFKNVLTSIAAIFCTFSKYHMVQCVWWWYQCDIFMGSHRSGQTERWAILSVAINSTYPDTLSRKRGNIFPFIPIVCISPYIFQYFVVSYFPLLQSNQLIHQHYLAKEVICFHFSAWDNYISYLGKKVHTFAISAQGHLMLYISRKTDPTFSII